jgi:hypothetical protein
MDQSESTDIPSCTQPEVEPGVVKKNKRSHRERVSADRSAVCTLPVRFMIVACPYGDEDVEDSEEEAAPKKVKKEKKKRVVTEASTRSINLWRKVTHEVTGSKKIVKKDSPEYPQCLEEYHRQRALADVCVPASEEDIICKLEIPSESVDLK